MKFIFKNRKMKNKGKQQPTKERKQKKKKKHTGDSFKHPIGHELATSKELAAYPHSQQACNTQRQLGKKAHILARFIHKKVL